MASSGWTTATTRLREAVLLLRGENPSRVMEGVHAKVAELNQRLKAEDVQIVPYLDRSTWLMRPSTRSPIRLRRSRSRPHRADPVPRQSAQRALIVGITIPFAMMVAFSLMNLTNIPANLLSLGAIDFGIIVDGAIVMSEAILRRREAKPDEPLTEDDVRETALQVARPIFFATLIIITAYVPLFAFQRDRGKILLAYGLCGRFCAIRRAAADAHAHSGARLLRLSKAVARLPQSSAGLARRCGIGGRCNARSIGRRSPIC